MKPHSSGLRKRSWGTALCWYALLGLAAMAAVLPLIYMIANSFMGRQEILTYYGALFGDETGSTMPFHLLPDSATLDGYYQMLLRRTDILTKYWNSLLLTGGIVAGQVVLSCVAGYGFAKFRFPGRNAVFFLFIVLMMMPYQVTLVPNYIVLDKLGLIGSYAAILLPGIFAAFGVFLMRQVFASVPDEIIEAAKLDGANQLQILFRVAVPQCKAGVASLVILSFVDNWNMVEQPLVFLKDASMYPLSVFLSSINAAEPGLAFACGVLSMATVLLLFLFFEEELVTGIEYANLK